jgi:hypothetical protein
MAIFFGVLRAVLERLQPHSRPFDRLRAHSCLRPHVQKSFAHHPDVGQCKQRHQVGSVLGQPPVLDLDVAKLALDDPKRMFDLRSDAGLGFLQLLQDGAHRRALVHGPALARHHGNVPLHLWVFCLDFFALFNAPVTRVSKDVCFLPVQQRVRLGDIM